MRDLASFVSFFLLFSSSFFDERVTPNFLRRRVLLVIVRQRTSSNRTDRQLQKHARDIGWQGAYPLSGLSNTGSVLISPGFSLSVFPFILPGCPNRISPCTAPRGKQNDRRVRSALRGTKCSHVVSDDSYLPRRKQPGKIPWWL